MNNMKKTMVNIAIFSIIVAITLVFFFVGFSKGTKTKFDYISLLFVIVSETALFTGLIFLSVSKASKTKTLFKLGKCTTLSGYWIITTLISLFSRSLFDNSLAGLVTVQISIIGITVIICIILLAFTSLQRSNEKIKNLRGWLQDSENIVYNLKNDIKFKEYNGLLEELYETLRYSDKIATDMELDKEIVLPNIEQTYVMKTEVNESINNKIEMAVVSCKGCGANSKIIKGTVDECQFCGSPISD